MHEMSLVSSLHEIVNGAMDLQGDSRVRCVYLKIGQLSCVDPDTLRWCISSTAEGTRLEHADIVIDIEPGLAHCERCDKDYEPETLMSPCPHCGTNAQTILSGRDMRVSAIDIDADSDATSTSLASSR